MQPREFSDIKTLYPPILIKGKTEKYPYFPGINYTLSERGVFTDNYFSGFLSEGCHKLNLECSKR